MEPHMAQIPDVLLGAQQRIRAAGRGGLLQIRRFRLTIGMMICEGPLACQMEAPLAEVVEKRGWIADPAKSEKAGLFPILFAQGNIQTRNSQNVLKAGGCVKNRAGSVAPKDGFDCR